MYDIAGTIKRNFLATGEKKYAAQIRTGPLTQHRARRWLKTRTAALAYGARLAQRANRLAEYAQRQEEESQRLQAETDRTLQELQDRFEIDLDAAALSGKPKDQSE